MNIVIGGSAVAGRSDRTEGGSGWPGETMVCPSLHKMAADGPIVGECIVHRSRLNAAVFTHTRDRCYRLAEAGQWSSGSPRRTYQLTNRGHAALIEQRDQWQEFVEATSAVLKGVQTCPNPT